MELAEQEQRGGRREVVFAELDSLTPGGWVKRRVAELLLGERGEDGPVAAEPLTASLRDRTLLLVLDTCEHVLDECGQLLGELLPEHPKLRVLTTSREPLCLPGETVHPMSGLPLPDLRGGGPHPSGYLHWDAMRLFCERAQSVAPGFQITKENAEHVGAICTRLDGLPLAIELAARLVGTLPLPDIHDRLDKSVSLLIQGWRTSDRRHQSLRAAFQWSYDLLTPGEQRLFRRMSVLPGGFGPDAAAAVCSGERTPDAEVAALLSRLVAKSLITPCSDQPHRARFRMLESLRRYGHEQLRAEGEEPHVHDRSTAWLTERTSPLQDTSVVSSHMAKWLRTEQSNLIHALDWLSRGNDERQLLLAGALTIGAALGEEPGVPSVTRKLVSGALGRTDTRSAYRGIALEGAALLAGQEGEYDEALRLLRQAVELGREGGHQPSLSRRLLLLSLVQETRGEHTAALTEVHECLKISRRLGDDLMTSVALSHLGRHCLFRGDAPRARKLIERTLPVLRAESPPRHLSAALHTAGALALERNSLPEAEKYFIELLQETAVPSDTVARAVEGLAVVAVRTHQFERGVRLMAAGLALGASPLGLASWWQERVRTALTTARQALPAKRCEHALALGSRLGPHHAVRYALGEEDELPSETTGGSPLSEREWDVIDLVVDGLTNRQIASRLYLSVRTVETHIHNIRTTLGLRSRAHLAAWAAQRDPRPDGLAGP
ncbi:LuxR C-terminal-related transcriptional regulator [Streptomyces sp. 5-10]|uniref:ATP-binding protein n=1 Tax=Streptomyces sp. 5-10 TaxID=878925 RepID=UPI00168A93C9|nr:LuxR C-terminal-related transcriptional regulator [Streptomyces sp. 5-10]MBD3003753.1 hypothetical protein [Streptomyces sp. 5-10]